MDNGGIAAIETTAFIDGGMSIFKKLIAFFRKAIFLTVRALSTTIGNGPSYPIPYGKPWAVFDVNNLPYGLMPKDTGNVFFSFAINGMQVRSTNGSHQNFY
jgi:hypothetical protein